VSNFMQEFELDFLLDKYKQILFIREIELSIGRKSNEGVFQTPIHLGIGQEAVAVGISNFLQATDAVFGNHRSHAHYLAMGGSPAALIAEVLGRSTGCSGGKGGSMHITARENGFIGSMPIVAGTISISLGSALALKMSKKNAISVSYFGDGASEEGVFHESLNFAAMFNLPVLFVCENNLFSSHLHIDERQVDRKISRFALAQGIKTHSVDGNNLLAMLSTAEEAIQYIRKHGKPAMIEASTYRLFGHVGFDEDLEVGLHRKMDLPRWKGKDPINKLRFQISDQYPSQKIDWDGISVSVQNEVIKIWEKALSDPFPGNESLLENVYWSN
jgi:TPP-dependent pyruvate/acetoin dehydrogenase alpha subunit